MVKGILNEQKLIYQQITQLIEEGIISGEYCAYDQVPSTNEIARVFNINPATAAKGVNLLVEEGVLYKKRGIGMFVCEDAQDILLKARRKTFVTEDAVTFIRKAKKLKFTREEVFAILEANAFEEE